MLNQSVFNVCFRYLGQPLKLVIMKNKIYRTMKAYLKPAKFLFRCRLSQLPVGTQCVICGNAQWSRMELERAIVTLRETDFWGHLNGRWGSSGSSTSWQQYSTMSLVNIISCQSLDLGITMKMAGCSCRCQEEAVYSIFDTECQGSGGSLTLWEWERCCLRGQESS